MQVLKSVNTRCGHCLSWPSGKARSHYGGRDRDVQAIPRRFLELIFLDLRAVEWSIPSWNRGGYVLTASPKSISVATSFVPSMARWLP